MLSDTKVVHFIWLQGWDNAPAKARAITEQWQKMNPGWTIMLWDDKSIASLIRTHFDQFAAVYENMPGNTEMASCIKRCDLARILILHQYGGVYADADLVPHKSIDSFLKSGVIYDRAIKYGNRLSDKASEDYIDLDSKALICSRENCRIDIIGQGVANGIIIAEPNSPTIASFISGQAGCENGLVLDYFGTWAWTRHLRACAAQLTDKLFIAPPHYFLWDRRYYKSEPRHWTVCEHPPGGNTWGDHSKGEWWRV